MEPADRPPRPPERAGTTLRQLAGDWLREHRHGYRFSPELELLPAFLGPGEPAGRVVELGSGNGALLFAALAAAPAAGPPALGLERQAPLVRLARDNARLRGATTVRPVQFLCADVRTPPLAAGCADRVLANPPFFPCGWGRESSEAERHASTHELAGGLAEFCAAAARLLAPDGKLVLVYGPERLAELLLATTCVGLVPTRLRLIRHLPRGTVARLFVEACRPATAHATPAAGLSVDEVTLDFAAARS